MISIGTGYLLLFVCGVVIGLCADSRYRKSGKMELLDHALDILATTLYFALVMGILASIVIVIAHVIS